MDAIKYNLCISKFSMKDEYNNPQRMNQIGPKRNMETATCVDMGKSRTGQAGYKGTS